MRPTRLTVRNIGIIADVVVDINKPLIVFYGEVMQGKSTLLNCMKWVMGGKFPDDIIKHGASEAFVQFEASEDGKPVVIRREWYRGKDQTIKARSIQMTRNGVPLKNPASEIEKLLNPFLLDQDHLRKMNSVDRQRYMVELFGVDTAEQDLAISELASEASELRIKVKSYGQIDLTKVDPADVEELKSQRERTVKEHSDHVWRARTALNEVNVKHHEACAAVDADNEATISGNAAIDLHVGQKRDCELSLSRIDDEIKALHQRRADRVKELGLIETYLESHVRKEPRPRPAMPDVSAIQAIIDAPCDTAEIDAKLADAGAQNVRHAQYLANKKRADEKAKDEQKILDLERGQRELKADKVAKLAAISGKCGVAGLTFAEDGSFGFEGVSAGMLSDSQLMRLSQGLSGLYPEGFGISLIDRGESMGKSVLDLWKDAQERERNILVTVVGDKPAKIPEQVGAFVIEGGKLF